MICFALLVVLVPMATMGMEYCPEFLKKEKSCSCYSYVDGAMIECDGPDSTDVIERLKLSNIQIRQLSINNADIIEIGPRAFRNLRIKNLNLDRNRIRKIHPDALRGLEYSLLSLSMNNNKLTEVPTEALKGMANLLTLSLKCNNIGNMYTTAFRNVTNLIELNLGCNQICRISPNAFDGVKKNMQSLILDQNCLEGVPAEALRGFDNLLALHLQHNRISTIKQLEFMNMLNLMMVRLSGNQIRSIHRQAFTNVPNLRYLYIDRNKLTSIEPNALQQFKFLEIVDLGYNNIAEIPSGAFSNMEHLMQLILEGNMIVDIQPGAFTGSPLLLLMLGNNCLASISQDTLQGVPFLRQLSLANNNLRKIRAFAFAQLANLQMLDLSGNKIDHVPVAAFGFNQQITILLKENPIVCTQGYHIIQAGQGVHLLGQEDMVCKKKFEKTRASCPTRKTIPPPMPCCSDPKKVKSLPVIKPSLAKKVTTKPKMVDKMDSKDMMKTTPKSLSPKDKPQTSGSGSRKLNLERFWRLTRPPIDPITVTTMSPKSAAGQKILRRLPIRRTPDTTRVVAPTSSIPAANIPVVQQPSPRQSILPNPLFNLDNSNPNVVIVEGGFPPELIPVITGGGTLPPVVQTPGVHFLSGRSSALIPPQFRGGPQGRFQGNQPRVAGPVNNQPRPRQPVQPQPINPNAARLPQGAIAPNQRPQGFRPQGPNQNQPLPREQFSRQQLGPQANIEGGRTPVNRRRPPGPNPREGSQNTDTGPPSDSRRLPKGQIRPGGNQRNVNQPPSQRPLPGQQFSQNRVPQGQRQQSGQGQQPPQFPRERAPLRINPGNQRSQGQATPPQLRAVDRVNNVRLPPNQQRRRLQPGQGDPQKRRRPSGQFRRRRPQFGGPNRGDPRALGPQQRRPQGAQRRPPVNQQQRRQRPVQTGQGSPPQQPAKAPQQNPSRRRQGPVPTPFQPQGARFPSRTQPQSRQSQNRQAPSSGPPSDNFRPGPRSGGVPQPRNQGPISKPDRPPVQFNRDRAPQRANS